MRIPLVDLRAQYQSIKSEIDAAIHRVLDSGQFILGPEVEALEREVAAFNGTTHAVAVASGTDALELALRACGVGAGDEVLTSPYSFFATAEAIAAVGADPVFTDIDPATYNVDPGALAAGLSAKTRAVIPVHLFGHPCDMQAVLVFAKAHRLKVIEDCAQALGASFQGRPVGSFGDAAAISFYPTKNLGAYGDGGMVLTNDGGIASHVRLLRHHGDRSRYDHAVLGKNSRLDEIQSAILRVKLRYLDGWNKARRRHADRYATFFHGVGRGRLTLPSEAAGCRHVYHLYTVRVAQRDRLKQRLAAAGIDSQVYYPSILPNQPALASYAPRSTPCPNATSACADVLSLPLYPEITEAALARIADCVADHLQQ